MNGRRVHGQQGRVRGSGHGRRHVGRGGRRDGQSVANSRQTLEYQNFESGDISHASDVGHMRDIQENGQVDGHADTQVSRGGQGRGRGRGRGRGGQGDEQSFLNNEHSTEHQLPNPSNVMLSSSRGRGGKQNKRARKDPGTLRRSPRNSS